MTDRRVVLFSLDSLHGWGWTNLLIRSPMVLFMSCTWIDPTSFSTKDFSLGGEDRPFQHQSITSDMLSAPRIYACRAFYVLPNLHQTPSPNSRVSLRMHKPNKSSSVRIARCKPLINSLYDCRPSNIPNLVRCGLG